MLPQFWRNLSFNYSQGTALFLGTCFAFSSFAQTTPLSTPASTEYPGILQTFEKIIQVDANKFKNKSEGLIKSGKNYDEASTATTLELDPDFLNSIVLHSDAGYLKLAAVDKCRFYDTILADLLKSAEGKIKNVIVSYLKEGQIESAIVPKKDFLSKVVTKECPETRELIAQFQVKNLEKTLKGISFDAPNGREQCRNLHLSWVHDSKTPYLCQIYEYIKEAKEGEGDPRDIKQRRAMAQVLDGKLRPNQKDFIENICSNLDHEEFFCDKFLNESFWNKIVSGREDKIFVEDICKKAYGVATLTPQQLKQCLGRMRHEQDLCQYGSGRGLGLSPQMDCDSLSMALNHSSLRTNYRDCPASSDQMAITNMSRILLNLSKEEVRPYDGPCSSISSGETFMFNQKFDNEENWQLEACYFDKMNKKEVCQKTFFGSYANHPASYPMVVASILKSTRGAEGNLKCKMIDSDDYNPLLLEFKSGCNIVYERSNCHMSQCKHKILYNDRSIDFIYLKNRLALEYFPLTLKGEKYSQHYLLTRDFKQRGRALSNLTSILTFFKKSPKGILHAVGCAEYLLPSFFKITSVNQCTPLPFIVDGVVKEDDKVAFVTRTSADTLQAPRLIGWSNIFSSVKTYQRLHPLKLWTLHGLD